MPLSFSRRWQRFWVKRSAPHGFGKLAAVIAAWNTTPFHGRTPLSRLHPKGFIAPSACINHPQFITGARIFLGDRVMVTRFQGGGPVELGDEVQIYGEVTLSTGMNGRITIGAGTHIQPGVHVHSYVSEIRIGRKVEVAPRCAFYSYNHCIAPDQLIMDQPLESKGPITIGDGAWLGHGVIVLAGVTIGEGAVIGAGSVVTRDVPDYGIAAGNPAKVIGSRRALGGEPPLAPATPVKSHSLSPVQANTHT